MLEFALVISLESVKCVEDSDVSSKRGCWRSESKNDVFGVGVVVASFGSVLRRTGRLPINHKITMA